MSGVHPPETQYARTVEGSGPPYRPGDLIGGRYDVRSLLDQGGSSEVYLATDRRLPRSVVLKVPRAALHRDTDALVRFRREAEALARIDHPYLVTIHDVELEPPYLVEEYVAGRSLSETLREQGSFPLPRAAEIGAAAADAVAAVHEAGMLHRDLKPGNLMLTPGGGVKLLDLGIAWAPWWTPLSGADEIHATAAYVSPEQAAGRPLDARSDIYALGVLLYEMVAGRPPFQGTPLELLEHHARQEPRPLGSIRHDVPPDFAAIVERCLAKDPARRIQSARIVAEELREWLRDEPDVTVTQRLSAVTERLPRTPDRRWRRFIPAAVGALLLAAALFALPQAEASVPPPTRITAHGACDGFLQFRATVSWRAPSQPVDGYEIFRRSLPDGTWTRVAVIHYPSTGTYTDHGLGADSEYGYEVRATQGDRVSHPSRPASAGTPLFCFG